MKTEAGRDEDRDTEARLPPQTRTVHLQQRQGKYYVCSRGREALG